ncbi:MAG: PKD domain-containing protein, partial [Bacteroidota bacterium]
MTKRRHLIIFIIIFLNCIFNSYAQITLTHNVGDELINPNVGSCSQPEHWARAFTLSEFGITTDDEFQINSGNVGVRNSVGQENATLQFNIYSIDSGFPGTFSESNLIGSSQIVFFPFVSTLNPQIVTLNFDTPVIVPANVERILVEVKKTDGTGVGVMNVQLAGTEEGGDAAWYKGCLAYYTYTSTDIAPLPRPDANLFITANGIITNNTINYNHACLGDVTEFHANFDQAFNSILWDFGDGNTSILENPTHVYGASSIYDVSATIYATDNSVLEVINKQIEIFDLPIINPISDINSCEDSYEGGFSSFFDTSNVESEILNGQEDVIIKYFDEHGNELSSPLPNPLSNSIQNNETITVLIYNQNALDCYVESAFDLIVTPVPFVNSIDNIVICDENNDGFSVFDISDIPIELINGQSNLFVELFDSNNNLISVSDYNNFVNLTVNQDYIEAIVTNSITNCSSETNVNLIVNDNPEANQLQIIYGCDDNNDGISEYFDTSNVDSQVLNGQTGMTVSYFDQSGNQLSNPLPNPFTNSNPFNQLIIVKVTDTNTTCYAETTLELQTVTQPNINQPDDLYECNQGNGYAEFNTSNIEQQLIGNQTGLTILYFDSNNNPLPSPLPALFQNTEPFSQTINIRIEDTSNPICYSETSFHLIVNELPVINLENEYFICNLEPSISLNINSGFNSYNWFLEDGTLISDINSAEITEEGSYTLIVTQMENGIICENSFDFNLIRSDLPEIHQINYGELGNN